MRKLPITLTAALSILILSTSAVQAAGLIQKLPEDGSWVEYTAEGKEIDANNPKDVKGGKGSLTISSVGTETVDREKCRWIEIYINSRQDNQNEDDQIILKLLIREKHLKQGENPGKNIIRGWQKRSRGQMESRVRQITIVNSRPSIEFLRVFLVGPLEKQEKLKPEVVETEKGKLQCAGERGEFSFEVEAGKQLQEITGKISIRRHDTVPFGVVSYNVYTREPLSKDIVTFNLKLREYGKGAQSQLPDHK